MHNFRKSKTLAYKFVQGGDLLGGIDLRESNNDAEATMLLQNLCENRGLYRMDSTSPQCDRYPEILSQRRNQGVVVNSLEDPQLWSLTEDG